MATKKVAILVENLYEEVEFWYPYYRMKEAGAGVTIVGTGSSETYRGKHGIEVKVDTSIERVKPEDFDALIIPGGYCPDYLRRYSSVLNFVKNMDAKGKVVAAICHAGWVLVSAGIVKGRKVTCFKSIRDDVINAGGIYIDHEVVRDRNLITSRFPDDLPYFCREIISALEKVEVQEIKTKER
jgi:protease I